MNKMRLLLICLLATFIMSGLVTPIGLLTAPAAAQYGIDITIIAARFSFFIGGVFLGYILSFFVFDFFRMKNIIVSAYGIAICAILSIHYFSNYSLLAYMLVLIGICASIGACAGGTLITRLWQGRLRQSVLVAQDAMFNGGGVVFAFLASQFNREGFAWSTTYMVVAALFLFVLLLALMSTFSSGERDTEDRPAAVLHSEWNSGFVLVGISLLLFLFSKITIFIWAPQFVEQSFAVDSAVSGRFMSNIFMAAFVGSLAGTYIVSKVNVKYVLYTLVILAIVCTWLFTHTTSIAIMHLLGFAFGISISATYNSYVAYALTFVAVPTHKHIAYLLLAGGLGSALAPLLSSMLVEYRGEESAAITLCMTTFVVGFAILILANTMHAMRRRQAQQQLA